MNGNNGGAIVKEFWLNTFTVENGPIHNDTVPFLFQKCCQDYCPGGVE